jgi:alpha-L-rhamnosidase
MTFATGYFESPYGRITSGWEKTATGYIYRVTIPANTTASLNLTASDIGKVTVLKGKDGVGPFRTLTGKVMAELKSGTYEFEVKK